MRLFYNIAVQAYAFAVRMAAPFNKKASKMIKGRAEVWQKLESVNLEGCYWFHAPSLGEFEQGRPVIEALKVANGNCKILLTFFSPSGYDVRKDYSLVDCVCYLPFDSKRNARRFVNAVRPAKAIFVKYDIWYHYLHALHTSEVPAYLISAIFRNQQVFFKWYGVWYKKALLFYKTIFVQDLVSQKLLEEHFVENSIVAGDTRFDRVFDLVRTAKAIPELDVFNGQSKIIVAGSTWPADENLLVKFIHQAGDDVKFIIAPHEVHEAHVQAICKMLHVPYQRWTCLNVGELAHAKVLVVDTIGMLSSLYKYAALAYIGGGFGVGIHNTLEAATYGLPVVFGPNYSKFKEARDLIQRGGATSIETYESLKLFLDEMLGDSEKCTIAGNISSAYVGEMRGATKKIIQNI